MLEYIIMFLLYWVALFWGGYIIATMDSRAGLLIGLFYICGLLIYFYQLAIGDMGLPSSSPSSVTIGAIGLFLIPYLGTSLGLGYIVGRFVEERR